MNLQEIRQALKAVLDGVDGVRGYDYMPGVLVTSSAGSTAVVITGPEAGTYVDYLEAGSGGQVKVHLECRIYVQLADLTSAQRRLDELLSAGTGESKSLVDAVLAGRVLGGAAMDCAPYEASPAQQVQVGETAYLAASLTLLVIAQRT